nr:nucleotide-binding, alpha-beta plait [Tanacetum cinerariifolium]
MATTEQPPKKRRPPYDSPQQSQFVPVNPITPTTTLPPEIVAQKRRNQEEIIKFYDSYKRLKNCVANKNDDDLSQLEQAYLALIAASRGCTSVQRLVAEFVPRYASHCPTAFEAATKVCINMHNCNIEIINRGEDSDGFSFETSTICIFGLATICEAASSETLTSSVIQGICSTVFLDVLKFFVSSFEGKGVFEIVNKDVVKMYGCPKTFSELKKNLSDGVEAPAVKLSKFRALCILWIFFSCPRNLLAACFEFCSSSPAEGQYILNLLTSRLDTTDGNVSIDNSRPEDESFESKNCLLCLVLDKDPSLKQWILSKVKSITKSALPNVVSVITSSFERIFKSFTEQLKAEDKQVESDVYDSSPSKSISRQFSVPRTPGGAPDQLSGLQLDHHTSKKSEADIRSNPSPNSSGGPVSMDVDSVDHSELLRVSSSTPKAPSTRQTSLDLRSSSFGRINMENHSSRREKDVSSLHVSSGGQNSNFQSPKRHFPSWYCDGDRDAMDIYSASRNLWLGSLGPEASEPLIGYQFERFGPIDSLLYVPSKGFAVIGYKNIMDAVKAREVMSGRSPWGACLIIKFLDIWLGTRGDINGVAVGSCCDVYVGNIHSQSDKDEILYEVRKLVFKGPLSVNDLVNEGALLMEFGTPEEAATVMAHLRPYRKEKRDLMTPVDRSSHGSVPMHVDSRNNNLGNGIVISPHAQPVAGFSHGMHNTNNTELNSPRITVVNQGATMQSGYSYQAGAPEQNWTYGNPENAPHSTPIQGHNYAPSQPIQPSSYMRPMYYPPNNSWDSHGHIHHAPINPNNFSSSAVVPPFLPASVTPLAQIQGNPLPPHRDQMFYAPPPLNTIPTPQPHMPPPQNMPPQQNMASPFPPQRNMASPFPPQQNMASPFPPQQNMASPFPPQQNMASSFPPQQNMASPFPPQQNMASPFPPQQNMPPAYIHPEMPPPLPPTPPFLEFQPPPPPPMESSVVGSGGYWQGTLSKSGVHYSNIHARRLRSDVCNYGDSFAEPAEWPAKLDITKRTDFRHVMSTFSSTPTHRREVCQLLPTSAGDHKGFQDFISYLKQRECAGVIKIPATKTIWARLLFILPYSSETCSLLSVTPDTTDCLLALVLPKETNFEWV